MSEVVKERVHPQLLLRTFLRVFDFTGVIAWLKPIGDPRANAFWKNISFLSLSESYLCL